MEAILAAHHWERFQRDIWAELTELDDHLGWEWGWKVVKDDSEVSYLSGNTSGRLSFGEKMMNVIWGTAHQCGSSKKEIEACVRCSDLFDLVCKFGISYIEIVEALWVDTFSKDENQRERLRQQREHCEHLNSRGRQGQRAVEEGPEKSSDISIEQKHIFIFKSSFSFLLDSCLIFGSLFGSQFPEILSILIVSSLLDSTLTFYWVL